jgi:hypothetical protein
MQQRQASAHTTSSDRDTFGQWLKFTQQRLHKAPSQLMFEELDAPLFGAFLCTAAVSIDFALLAASPDMVGLPGRLWSWLEEAAHGRASIRDLRSCIRREWGVTDGVSNLLIYEDRVELAKDAHWVGSHASVAW